MAALVSATTLQRVHNDYTVGWICPLEVEQIAAVEMLDEEHPHLSQPSTDNNSYTLGSIQNHNVVLAGLPTTGNCSTATVVAHMRSTFPRVKFGLLVGIGGGVPRRTNAGHIRLGDVVVSSSTIQYDHGAAEVGEFRPIGALAPPPNVLLNAARRLAIARARAKEDPLKAHLQRIDTTIRDYSHVNRALSCQQCCDPSKIIVQRADGDDQDAVNEDEWVEIHRGVIASGELVMRNGILRDILAAKHDILCFEMEAAGALNDFPCLVIRGISDYSDSHKNDRWHDYAAGTAAAYARELFFHMPTDEVAHCQVAESDVRQMLRLLFQDSRGIASGTRGARSAIKNIESETTLRKLPWADGSTFDSFEESDELNSLCLKGTRVELLQEIGRWVADEQGKTLFWLNGMAGTGKSTISRTLAGHLKQKNQLGASFFFKIGQDDCGNARRFITTIASQMARSFPGITSNIIQVLEVEDPHIANKGLSEQFEKLLFQPLSAVEVLSRTPIVIVIDALDECRPRFHITAILSLLSRLRDLRPLQVRVFLTSRPEQELRSGFEEITRSGYQDTVLHQIPQTTIEHDIEVFLRYHFNLIRNNNKDNLDANWPGENVIATLVAKAQPLFIYAATICRFIGDPKHDPEVRLRSVLDNQDDQAYDKVHNTYKPILDRLIEESTAFEQSKAVENFQRIVGSIVILFEPLSVNNLAKLLQDKVGTIKSTLSGLHSLLDIPQYLDLPIRPLHLSFVDFLTDKKRQNTHFFWLDAENLHRELASSCLKLLLTDGALKHDICGLKMPCTLRADIGITIVNYHLSPAIQYACQYWTAHLGKLTSNTCSFEDSVCKFFKQRFLFWFEALSLIGRAWDVSPMMSTLSRLFSQTSNSDLKLAIYDARRFVIANCHIADIAPLQLYSSCLIFSPQQSNTRLNFSRYIPSWLKQPPTTPDHWGTMVQTLEVHSSLSMGIAFSSNGILASGSIDGFIDMWNISSGIGRLQQRLKAHSRRVNVVVFSSNNVLASGSYDGTIKLWDTSSGIARLQKTLEAGSWVEALTFSSDGILAAGLRNCTIKLWNVASGELQRVLKGHSEAVQGVAFSSDGKLLASCTWETTVILWNIVSGELQNTLNFSGYARHVAFSSRCKLLACASGALIILENLTSGEQKILRGHLTGIMAVVFSPDGKLLASCSDDGTVKLWDVSSGELQKTLNHSRVVHGVVFSSNGEQLASVSDYRIIKLWDITSDITEPQQNLNEHSDWVYELDFSPNGRILASTAYDKTLKLWDVALNKLRQTIHLNWWIGGISFHKESPQIRTEQGCFKIQQDLVLILSQDIAPFHLQDPEHVIFGEKDDWLIGNGRRFLWLPPDYRVRCMDQFRGDLALATYSGHILLLKISFEELNQACLRRFNMLQA